MGTYYETKHDAYKLKFKEHEVFKDQLVVVDESDTPFLWLNKDTGKVSFSGKYFHLYKEQRLVEALKRLQAVAYEFIERKDEIVQDRDELEHFVKRFGCAISFVKEIEADFKINQSSKQSKMKFFEVHDPYYALIKAENKEKAVNEYIHNVAADEDGKLIDEIEEVDRDYAIAQYSRGKSEDGKEIPLKEILEDVQNDRDIVLLFDGSLA